MNIQKKDFDYQFKLVVVGDTNVGKSSLLIRFIDNTFKDSTVGVIGVDFVSNESPYALFSIFLC